MNIRSQEDVRACLGIFYRHAEGRAELADGFMRLVGELHMRQATGEDVQELGRAVAGVAGEHSTLFTILERSASQKDSAAANHLDHTQWLFFATLDVEHYQTPRALGLGP